MAGISLTQITNEMVEPAPAFRFELEMPAIRTIGGTTIQPLSGLMAQRVSVGGRSITMDDMYWAGWQRSFATGSTTEDVSVTFVEKFDYSIYRYFDEWMNIIHSSDGNFGLPGGADGYWKNITVYGLDLYGKRMGKFFVRDANPLNRPPYDFDGATTNYLQFNITFKCFQIDFTQMSPNNDTASNQFTNGTGSQFS